MTPYVALVRAVNVGGQKLLMDDLKAIAEALGLQKVRTYIASGNLLFFSAKSEALVKRDLEAALKAHLGKPIGVMVRTAKEMSNIVASNPFPRAGKSVVALFLDEAPPRDTIADATGFADEEVALGEREIYVHYPGGMGRSKLRISAAKAGTARNMNTVTKLAQLAKEMT